VGEVDEPCVPLGKLCQHGQRRNTQQRRELLRLCQRILDQVGVGDDIVG